MTRCSVDFPDRATARERAALPLPVARYLERALPWPGPLPEQVALTQTGTMWGKPGARPMQFNATERLAVNRVAFLWEARFRVAALPVKVRDRYDAGDGGLQVSALGLPVQRHTGPEISAGEAYRYLAELPWVPHAIAANRELEWEQTGPRSAEVACRVRGERIAVRFDFNSLGDIARCSATARPRDLGGASIPTPWGGEFSAYRSLGAMRMPTSAEVHWDPPEGRFVYWRGTVTDAYAVQEPFVSRR